MTGKNTVNRIASRNYGDFGFCHCRPQKIKAKTHFHQAYASQKLPIDDEKSLSADWNIQIIYLWQKLLFSKMQFVIVASPKCQLLDVLDQFRFLHFVKPKIDEFSSEQNISSLQNFFVLELFIPAPCNSGMHWLKLSSK